MPDKMLKEGVGTLDAYLKTIGESMDIDKLSMSVIAGLIDHTALKPETTESDIINLCEDADKYKFKSVCVNPGWVHIAAEILKESPVKICTVIGFPLGANTCTVKGYETEDAVKTGADEIDMVINIGELKSNNLKLVEEDIKGVVSAAGGRIVKVILEICLLSPKEIETACRISMDAGANYVKTSTGFSTGGATVEALTIMRKTVGGALGVKASGGIKDYPTLVKMLEAGATRIGSSSGAAILSGGSAAPGTY